MVAKEFFLKLDNAKAEMAKFLPLSTDAQQKLDKKLRLEWNYNSNHIEGNTLTYAQTELLLISGKTTGDNEKREWDEMQAHDVAIKLIKEYAKDAMRPITESDIRQLNKTILVEPFWKEAITPDGQPTRKLVEPGQYKGTPNQVRLQNGEIHRYASPEETPALMSELITWLNAKKDLHPVMEAAIFHHRLTQIHPFDDGNGRVARLVANLLLLKVGYTPLIIRSANKSKYIIGLERADAGDYAGLVSFIIEELTWTLELAVKAAKGESLEEPGDIDKRIEMLKRTLNKEDVATTKLNSAVARNFMTSSILPLIKSLEENCTKLTDLFFNDFDRRITAGIGGGNVLIGAKHTSWEEIDSTAAEVVSRSDANPLSGLDYYYQLQGFKKSKTNQYMNSWLQFQFNPYSYIIRLNQDYPSARTYSYDVPLDKTEIDVIVGILIDKLLEQISEAGGLKKS